MTRCEAVYLSGDSFPSDDYIEDSIRTRLSCYFLNWINQHDIHRICDNQNFNGAIEARLSALQRVKTTRDASTPWVLFGRSSGARVATLFASEGPAAGVVCLGYPFRNPKLPEEPQRFRHLATITTPTLIVQGIGDVYGGRSFPRDYALSGMVEVHFVECDHEFRVKAEMWDNMASRIAAFLAGIGLPSPFAPTPQDMPSRRYVSKR